jgi:hypothetical protein
MRRLALVLALCAAPLAAQTNAPDYTHTIVRVGNVSLMNHHPACNPFAQAFDPVWIHGEGWTMPRIGWHLMYPAINLGIAYGLTKLHVNRKVAAIVGPIPLEIAPHLRQAALGLKQEGRYELNLPDWAYDAENRSFPSWVLLSDHQTTKRDVAIWLVGDVALSCFARP